MVRNYVRKTNRVHSDQNMREAVELVENGESLRKAANLKNVNYMTLFRYVNKKKNTAAAGSAETMRVTPNYENRKVFSESQEAALKEYIKNCAKMCYGLDTVEVRKLAYEMAKFHNLTMPDSWQERQKAGKDWLYTFKKRHPDLTLRKPESCSLSRATSFNRHNVDVFYTNLEDVLKRHPGFADGTRIFALDETGTTTVQKPKKVMAEKGQKQLNKVTSAERGTLVTTCCAVSATGNALPPAMVFPRKTFKTFMTNGAPTGTLGLAQQTGWMNSELFPEVLKHFIKITSSSKENPSLLILDNHESHLAPAVLNIAKENGVTLLTIPPHTSHRLQPLDVSVFGPLQKFYNAAADAWMLQHPGKTISIYDVAGLLGTAFDRAMTPANIKSGFRKTGIFPFDRHIFTDEDFLPSEVTNRPLDGPSNATLSTSAIHVYQAGPSNETLTEAKDPDSDATNCSYELDIDYAISTLQTPSKIVGGAESSTKPSDSDNQASSSSKLDVVAAMTLHKDILYKSHNRSAEYAEPSKQVLPQTPTNTPLKTEIMISNFPAVTPKKNQAPQPHLHPKNLRTNSPGTALPPNRGYPKAGPRLESSKGRKRGKSVIATDTPVKAEFEIAALQREEKKKGKKAKVTKVTKTEKKKRQTIIEKAKKVLFDVTDDDAESDIENISDSSSDTSIPLSCYSIPKEGDFVVVKFPSKQVKHFIGKLLTNNLNGEYEINYLRKSAKVDNTFYFPLEPDLAIVASQDIEIVIPVLMSGKSKLTKRQSDLYTFPRSILKRFNFG